MHNEISALSIKKIVSIFILLFILLNNNYVNAAKSFTISAIVGNSNHTPVITEFIPSSDTVYLAHYVSGDLIKQSYSVKFRDDEKDEVTYTITPESNGGSVLPSNGTILSTSYNSNNEAYIFFEYFSPTTAVGAKTFTLTISDGPNVTIKTFNVYIY